jgi:capsular polysaccharide biosynthesis protein
VAGGSEGVQGFLATATRGRVSGWAWNPGIEDRLEVGVLIDGEQVAADVALVFDEPLRAAGIGDGAHAFAIPLPGRLCDRKRHSIGAVVLASGETLSAEADFVGESPPGDPWYLTCFVPETGEPPAGQVPAEHARTDSEAALVAPDVEASGPRGCLEMVADGCVLGWAHNPGFPQSRLALEVLVDGEIVAETVADLLRPSLARENIGDGRHAFIVALPVRLCDGGTHSVAIRPTGGDPGDPLPPASAFATVAKRAPEWQGTTFVAPNAQDGLVSPTEASGPRTPVVPSAHTLNLRSRDELQLSRRTPGAGAAFTSRDGAETVVLGLEMDVDPPDPLHFAVQPHVADPLAERRLRFDSPRRYSVPRSLASRLPHAIVDTTSFVIMPGESEYLLDSVRHPATLQRWGYERLADGALRYELGDVPEREERVVVLGAQSNANYSHWLLESLVRAILFRPLDDGTWLYLTPPLTDWQRQTLDLIGLEAERILELEPQGPVRFREAVAVSRGMGGLPAIRPAGVVALAKLAAPSSGRRRLYCSRAGTRHRHASNETELVELLARHGFETVSPERLSIAEQIELFAGAEVVFALHGSALTNIAFSRPGTLVIELQAEGFNYGGVVWNWILASLRGQPFVQVVCPLSEESADLPHASRDVTVDIRHLDALLYRVLPG